MEDNLPDDAHTFVQMARDFPVRTSIFTFGLPAFALLQLINGFVYEGSLVYIGIFAAALVAYSVTLTQCHVAAYRRDRLTRRWIRNE